MTDMFAFAHVRLCVCAGPCICVCAFICVRGCACGCVVVRCRSHRALVCSRQLVIAVHLEEVRLLRIRALGRWSWLPCPGTFQGVMCLLSFPLQCNISRFEVCVFLRREFSSVFDLDGYCRKNSSTSARSLDGEMIQTYFGQGRIFFQAEVIKIFFKRF